MSFISDDEVKDCLFEYLEDNPKITRDGLKELANIGSTRASRILNELYDDGDLKHRTNYGYFLKNDDEAETLFDEYIKLEEEIENDIDEELDKNLDSLKKENELLRSKLIKMRRKTQLQHDKLIINRRENRKEDRDKNVADMMVEAIKENICILPNSSPYFKFQVLRPLGKIAIVQCSDWHMNQNVFKEDVFNGHQFNWNIISARAKKYAIMCKEYMELLGIKHIILANTGDMFNSTRRYDEMVRNPDSAAIAFLKGVNLKSQFILDLCEDKETKIFSTFGNESRLKDKITSVHWENNWDYLAHKMLQIQLKDQSNITFVEPKLNHSCVIPANLAMGANILLIHGHNKTDFNKECLKYAKDPVNPIIINYVLHGHFHETKTDGDYRRSSGMVGTDPYASEQLAKDAQAEQNFHILIKEHADRIPVLQTIPMNLDYVGGIEGYDISY